jgi:hypothetical protein
MPSAVCGSQPLISMSSGSKSQSHGLLGPNRWVFSLTMMRLSHSLMHRIEGIRQVQSSGDRPLVESSTSFQFAYAALRLFFTGRIMSPV